MMPPGEQYDAAVGEPCLGLTVSNKKQLKNRICRAMAVEAMER